MPIYGSDTQVDNVLLQNNASLHIMQSATVFADGRAFFTLAGIPVNNLNIRVDGSFGSIPKNNEFFGFQLSGSNINFIVTGSMTHVGMGGIARIEGSNNFFSNSGSITGQSLGGNDAGFQLFGGNNTFENSGLIRITDGVAVTVSESNNTFENSGLIRITDGVAVTVSGSNNTLENSGLIQVRGGPAFEFEASAPGTTNSVINSGTIEVTDSPSKLAIDFGAIGLSDDQLLNTGVIKGDVALTFGNDLFDSSAGQFFGAVFGGNGNDTLLGGAQAETLDGGFGTDLIQGGGGADLMRGRVGDDTYRLSDAAAVVVEDAGPGTGIDTIETSVSYTLSANVEVLRGTGGAALVLTGNDGNNTLVANGAGNRLAGGAGFDVLTGGAGNDVFVFDGVDQIGDTAGGFDTVETAVSLSLTSVGIDAVVAVGGAAVALTGGAGAESLTGNGAANRLSGGAGNDRLAGKAGQDVLNGGSGRDAFVFHTRLAKSNVDRITDFNVKDDSIHLENAVMTKLGKAGKLKSDAFHIGKAAADDADRVIYDKSTGKLFYDRDGEGGAAQVQIAALSKNLKMTAADFLVI